MIDSNRHQEVVFRSDTRHRKEWFTGVSFQHPARMMLPLQLYLFERYTKPGDVVLDCMAGSGTALVGCSLGRHVICVELEPRFCEMMRRNWEKVRQRGPQMGYEMGEALILCGDARNLEGLLADVCLFSPPYAEAGMDESSSKVFTKWAEQHGRNPEGHAASGITQRQYAPNPDNIGSLPYGSIDQVLFSPPFGEAHDTKDLGVGDKDRADLRAYSYLKTETEGQIANLPYGDPASISAICFSPPYEASISGQELDPSKKAIERQSGRDKWGKHLRLGESELHVYSESKDNIGNLKSADYLSAMFLVYQQCHKVLRLGGLLILILKPFIREGKIVPLQEHSRQIVERAGFTFVEELHRKLLTESFWRIIARQRCDHRRGSKQAPKCKLGLECPIRPQMQTAFEGVRTQEQAVERLEKLCPQYINSSPTLDTEFVLVFRK